MEKAKVGHFEGLLGLIYKAPCWGDFTIIRQNCRSTSVHVTVLGEIE